MLPYVFLYVTDLDRARSFYQDVLALPVVETDEVASKYDCGTVMLALNVVPPPRDDVRSVLTFEVPDVEACRRRLAGSTDLTSHDDGSLTFEDPDAHRFRVTGSGRPDEGGWRLTEVVLDVPDVDSARKYYGELLGLPETLDGNAFDMGPVVLSLRADPGTWHEPGVPPMSYVLHAADCVRDRATLLERGVEVGPAVAGEIGVTARFADPAGHDFYLYEPSATALSWPSGPVYQRIAGERSA